ncbi:MAG: rod shape-determining protein [Clostridia bacterium]|nr:rod shape-determining protein [Clostridia bacterium]
MKKVNFAVSLGSNVTSIYKAGVGVVLSDKSAIVTTLKGKKEVAMYVGEDAITSGFEYKKVFSDGKIDFSLAELLLWEFFKKIEIGKRDGVVFFVALDDMKFEAEYRNLAYSLGVNTVYVLPSILATTYGFEIENIRKSFLLCDIGVNTEVAIINNGRLITGATIQNGGENIDNRIKEYILEEKGIDLTKESAEKVKNELATLLPNDERSIVVGGFIKDTTEYSSVTITSNEIFGIVVEEYSAISSAILQVLSSCNNEINQDVKKHGIYLCGASSKIVGIEKFFKVKLDLDSISYRPEAVTMIGAGQLLDSPIAMEKVILENGCN